MCRRDSRPGLRLSARWHPPDTRRERKVSPGFTSRPSLSGSNRRSSLRSSSSVAGIHVPAFVERDSTGRSTSMSLGVAGIHVPAFVERCRRRRSPDAWVRVAGIHVPAFVERRRSAAAPSGHQLVSPGFTSRPSLSDHRAARGRNSGRVCRRDSRPGLR